MPAEIVYMEKLPLLGTGKIDNMAVTKLIKERLRRAGAGWRRSRSSAGSRCGAPWHPVQRRLLRFAQSHGGRP